VDDAASLEEVSSVVLMLPDSAVVEAVLLGRGCSSGCPRVRSSST
jgi:3-hydroxyisobutyrate dehydrogenase-like beta-hydroxyacid dehydrogenase